MLDLESFSTDLKKKNELVDIGILPAGKWDKGATHRRV